MKTDQEHQLTTQEIINELKILGIPCERRTLYRDIETLINNGYEVLTGRKWREKTYYVEKRQFDIPEIKIIMEAIQSAAFIPRDKTDVLLDKLAGQCGSFRAELMKRNAICFQSVKHSNPNIYRNTEILEKAVENRLKISFYYYHLNENNEKVYSHGKKIYVEEPLGMLFDNSNYYLLCYRAYNEQYPNNVKVFRIDRMSSISVLDSEISREALLILKKTTNIRSQVFKMYGGRTETVTIQFDPTLVEVVFDKFGHDIKIRRNGDMCRVTVSVQISPTFWGWMLQFPEKMKIYSPDNIRQEYIEWVRSALK